MTEDEPLDGMPSIRVRGQATAEEIAAVVAAVQGAVLPESRRPTPPWLRAGLREGLGGRPASEPSDVRSPL